MRFCVVRDPEQACEAVAQLSHPDADRARLGDSSKPLPIGRESDAHFTFEGADKLPSLGIPQPDVVVWYPAAINRPSGEKATPYTCLACPSSVRNSRPVCASHSRMVLSAPAEASSRLSARRKRSSHHLRALSALRWGGPFARSTDKSCCRWRQRRASVRQGRNNATHPAKVFLKYPHRSPASHIPDSHCGVIRCRSKQPAIGRKSDAVHLSRVSFERPQQLAAPHR
jgi:hypothetical protein